MKKVLIFLIVCGFRFNAEAQPLNLSGTERSIPVQKVSTGAIDSLIGQGLNLVDNHTGRALLLLTNAVYQSRANNYTDGIANALMGISSCYAVRNDMAAADYYLNQAYLYCWTSSKKYQQIFKWQRHQFLVYKYMGYSDSALSAIRKALLLAEQLKDTALLVDAYNLIGSALIDNQDYNHALGYIIKAKDLNKAKNSELLVSYINLSYVYSIQKDTTRMHQWALKAYKLSRALKQSRYERSASLVLTKYNLIAGRDQKAQQYAQNAIRLIDTTASDNRLYVYRLLCSFYFDRQNYAQALIYGNIALQYVKPEQRKRKDVIALYSQMSSIYHALGNSDKAYDFLLKYGQLADSANFLERSKTVDKIEKRLQLSEKQKEIAQQENQLVKQQNRLRLRNIGIIITAGGALALLVLLLSFRRSSKRKIHIMRQQKEIDKLRAMMEGEEKERNRIAVELHDSVGGMLSAATHYLENIKQGKALLPQQNAFKRIDGIIAEVRNEIRKTAHTLMPDVLLRNSLPEAIRVYCNLIERDTNLQIDIRQQGNFDHLPKDIQLSLYRMTQELIQNILKHAQATRAVVQIHSGKDIISLTVEDNGIGFDPDDALKKDGMGLQNIRNRLQIMNGQLSVDSQPGKGTSIYAELNIAL